MKVSVITTVLNEESSVSGLIDSLLKQTLGPDEIIILDGGSTDKTPEIIQNYVQQYPYIKFLQKEGNIAAGRNEAIKQAKFPIIAQIDAGCVADKNWLARIVKPFSDPEVGLVAGFYVMTGNSQLQKAVAPFHGITPQKFDHRCYMPSGRSVAFRKTTWEAVEGYSENLQWAGEDTLFNYKVVKSGIKIARVPEAYVYWEVPKTYLETMKKFYKYALGDAQTGIWWHPGKNLSTHNIKIVTIFVRYMLALLLLFLALFNQIFAYIFVIGAVTYAFWSIWKLIEDVQDTGARLLVPVIQISSDFAVMAGFTVGMIKTPTKS